MRQDDIDKALAAFLEDGNIRPWRKVLQAVKDGEVTVIRHTHSLSFQAVSTPLRTAFGARLEALRQTSGLSGREIAERLDLSSSAVHRHLHGYTLSQWPVVAAMITLMGGDPEVYHEDYRAAKAERPS